MRIVKILLILIVLALVGGGLWLYTPDHSRHDAEVAYLRAPTDYREVAGLRLHVQIDGPAGGASDAPTLILLHGFSASLQTWDAWTADLMKDHRVIRFDLPGHGLSGADPTGDYSIPRSVDVLAALMDEVTPAGGPPPVLVGNSLGGLIAWEYAAAHPERVAKLVLLAPGGFVREGQQTYGVAAPVPAAFKSMPYVLKKGVLRTIQASLYGDPSRLTEANAQRYYDMLLAPGVRTALVARLQDFVLTDPTPRLATITTPTLLIWGEKDVMLPFNQAAQFTAAMPNVRLVAYPDVGHMAMEEVPERSLADLRSFLAEP